MENHPVMLRLTVGHVNRLLNLLGTHPYNVVADLLHTIKSQGDLQIAAAQAQQGKQVDAVKVPPSDGTNAH